MVESCNGIVAGGCWWWGGAMAAAPNHVCAYRFRLVLVMFMSLGYAGVHQEHHDHGRPYARTIRFPTEIAVGSLVFEQKCRTSAHGTMVSVLENGRRWRAEAISLRNPAIRQPFLSSIQRTTLLKKIGTLKPNSAVHAPLGFESKLLPEPCVSYRYNSDT